MKLSDLLRHISIGRSERRPTALPPRRGGLPVGAAGELTAPFDRVASGLFAQIEIQPLVYFRVAFGAIAFWEVCRYFRYGWIDRAYIMPKLHFTYAGFGWVRPWPGKGMYGHFVGLGATALMIAAGLWFRPAALLFAAGFSYVFLLEKAHYLNHFYLLSLLSWLLALTPANRAASIDAWRNPTLRATTTPAWTIWLLLGQISVAYLYGGIAKLNWDWLRGEPLRNWIGGRDDLPIIGRYVREEWLVRCFVYGGLLFDFLIVPLLLNRRTLPPALPLAAFFHLMNARLFRIGIFPWFMLAASVLYLPPSWLPWPNSWRAALPAAGPALTTSQRAGAALLAAYALAQLLVPLRHHLYPGNVSWTEEGHRFSWHMKLRAKRGQATFLVTDPASGQVWRIDPSQQLNLRQSQNLATHPDMVVQFAHFLANQFAAQGHPSVEVRAVVLASLNGRKPQSLIDPEVDLARVRPSIKPAPWIVPLTEPLPERPKRLG